MANGKRIGVKLYSDLARELKRRAGTVTRPLEKFAAFNSSFSAVAAAAAAADSHPSVSDDHKTFSLLVAVTLGAQLRRIFKTRLIQPEHFVPYTLLLPKPDLQPVCYLPLVQCPTAFLTPFASPQAAHLSIYLC